MRSTFFIGAAILITAGLLTFSIGLGLIFAGLFTVAASMMCCSEATK